MAPDEHTTKRFENDALVRLWQNAQDRETGAEAVAAIRARKQQELEAGNEKRVHRRRLRRRGS